MADLEIPDEPGPPPGGESPYRNLLVPLVVVPALIVMVLVLVFVLFGAIAGKETTPGENVHRLLDGGANERHQAAFALVQQVLEEWQKDGGDGKEAWKVDAALLPRIRAAWEQSRAVEGSDDVPIPLALTIILAHAGDPQGVAALADMTRLSDTIDPDGRYRSYAGFALGAIGERLDQDQREVAAKALIELLGSEDQGLREVGVIALQTLPTPATIPALQGMLAATALEVRLNAALSLVRLGDDSGAGVLLASTTLEPYAAEHEEVPAKWASAERVGESRRKALQALIDLHQPPDGADLERLAKDPDPLVRELALRIQQD